MIKEAPRRRHYNVRLLPQRIRLVVRNVATSNELEGHQRVLGEILQHGVALYGELASGNEYHGLGSHVACAHSTTQLSSPTPHARALAQTLEDGQQERSRLARTGFCRGKNIQPLQGPWQHVPLNGRGSVETEVCHGSQERPRQTKVREVCVGPEMTNCSTACNARILLLLVACLTLLGGALADLWVRVSGVAFALQAFLLLLSLLGSSLLGLCAILILFFTCACSKAHLPLHQALLDLVGEAACRSLYLGADLEVPASFRSRFILLIGPLLKVCKPQPTLLRQDWLLLLIADLFIGSIASLISIIEVK
mmetsp:Transcript_7148/g.15487  ORF Transcript_7148/g.15487 Transcript_7148/m.15487 type:complete len:309 (+) Transcript_7148:1287-2213(+)